MAATMIDRLRASHAHSQQIADRRIEMFIVRDWLDPDACSRLIAKIDANLRPSTIAGEEADPYFRTSETCDLFATDPFIAALDARLAAVVGADPAHGETNQGQRYLIGQEFKLHTDYFEPHTDQYEEHCSRSGQRTWTAMVYLNEPEAGGATRFKRIERTIKPEAGKLVLWNNLKPDGAPNPMTLHHGMKVRSGRKYIITKWFRERPVIG